MKTSNDLESINQRFIYLDFLRFAFAMIVFLGHARALLTTSHAHLAVDYFFILSGFVLSHAYYQKLGQPGFMQKFVRDRWARLYPLHFFTLMVFVLLNFWFTDITGKLLENGWSYQDGRAYTLLLNIGLLNNVGLSTLGPSWNAPAWSISVEFWLNLALAASALIFRKKLIPLLLFASAVSYVLLIRTPDGLVSYYANVHRWINTGLLRGLGGMGLGIFCFASYKTIMKHSEQIRQAPMVAISTTLVVADFWMVAGGLNFLHAEFLIVPLSALTVLAVAVTESLSINKAGIVRSVMVWLGECSYSIYLLHWAVLTFVNYFMNYAWGMDVDLKDPFNFSALVFTVIVLSRLSYLFIELPGKKFLKKRH